MIGKLQNSIQDLKDKTEEISPRVDRKERIRETQTMEEKMRTIK